MLKTPSAHSFMRIFSLILGGLAILGGIIILDLHAKSFAQKDSQIASVLLATKRAPKFECIERGVETYSCYVRYYENLVQTLGVETAIADLKARYPQSTVISSQCHQIVHAIGHAATTLYPTASEAFAHGDPVCWSGYYHGVIEKLVEGVSEGDLPSTLNSMCRSMPGASTYSFDYYNCVHGLGHGVMAYRDNDLFSSLDLCDGLTGEWEKLSCASGVFMENVMVEERTGTSSFFRIDDPLYPCNAVKDSFKSPCYLMHTSHMLKVSGENFQMVFDDCKKVEGGYRELCYQSLGRDASGHSVSSVETTKLTCALGPNDEARRNCIIGAVKDFISYFHSDTQARELCAAIDNKLKETCLSTATSYYTSF